MKKFLIPAMMVATMLSTAAMAEEQLFLYNWTDYTAPDIIKKFEADTGIKVVLDTYDSNETLLAKLQAGASGYDVIIPTHNFVPILISEGLVQKYDAKALPNFKNIEEKWRNPSWDKNQEYTVPFHWGTTSIAYREDLYGKKMESLGEYFVPKAELSGRISIFKTPEEAVNLVHLYLGQKFCNPDPAQMQKVQDVLLALKPAVNTFSSEGMNDRLLNGDSIMTTNWNGNTLKAREQGAASKAVISYAYPKEGVIGWMDNMMIPAKAANVKNAQTFINYLLDPKNMAMQSDFAGYGNAITGSGAMMSDKLKNAPEIVAPADVKVEFSWTCDAESQKLIDKVWTNVLK